MGIGFWSDILKYIRELCTMQKVEQNSKQSQKYTSNLLLFGWNLQLLGSGYTSRKMPWWQNPFLSRTNVFLQQNLPNLAKRPDKTQSLRAFQQSSRCKRIHQKRWERTLSWWSWIRQQLKCRRRKQLETTLTFVQISVLNNWRKMTRRSRQSRTQMTRPVIEIWID